jgi:hypothetical protein
MAVNVRLSSSQAESAKRQRVLENRIVLQEIKSWHGDGKTVSENSELSLNIIHETKIGISRSQEIVHVVIFNLTR